jgi:hypothetical protein
VPRSESRHGPALPIVDYSPAKMPRISAAGLPDASTTGRM